MVNTVVRLLWILTAFAAAAQPPAPIVLDGRTLWTIQASRAEFSPADRARDIQENILHVAADNRRNLSDIRELHSDAESILLLSRAYVFSVTNEDAAAENRPRQQLFAERKQTVLDAIVAYRQRRSLSVQVRSIVYAFGDLLLALAALILLQRLYHRLASSLQSLLYSQFHKSSLASIYRVFEAPLVQALGGLLRLVFFALALFVVFTLASVALSLFPATSGVSDAVVDSGRNLLAVIANNVIAYLPNLGVLVLVAISTYIAVWFSRTLAVAIQSGAVVIGGFHSDWALPTYGLVKILLIVFALVVAFPYLPGGDSQALKGASIFVGVLVSLGSGSAMGNVVSGVILTYMRPFRVGDRVQIGETVGDVIEKSLLVTRLRTIKNVEVILPNSSVLGTHILNYSAHADRNGLILHTTVTLGYDAPWRTVEELLIQAALNTPGIVAEPKPFVLQTSLNDSHISYELNATTRDPSRMAELYSTLHRQIQESFNTAGVEIMSPMYLSVRDGNQTTTPGSTQPPGSFQVHLRPSDSAQ